MQKILVFIALAFFSPLPAAPQPESQLGPEPEAVVILGGGIGSLTSAIYLARAGLQPLVIEGGTPGGLLTQSHSVQNWPSEMEIEGRLLTEKARVQAEKSGARFLEAEVVAVDFSKRPFAVTTQSLDGSRKIERILAASCIIGMGTTPNFLGVPGEQNYWGRGVSNCAICDGSLYQDKVVGVVGGGDAAILEAFYLSNIAKEVHLFIRGEALRAYEAHRIEMLKGRPNVTFHYKTEVVEVKGNEAGVTGVVLKSGKSSLERSLDGIFLAIGSRPNTELFGKALKLDKKGYISLKNDQETSVEGVYAIGDIVDPVYKQAITAAGDGAKAALQAQHYLMGQPKFTASKQEKKTPPGINVEIVEILSSQQFEKELKDANSPLVVDFYATWCAPCKQLFPLLESSAERLSGKVKFLKVNVDKVGDLSRSYEIRAMPTVLLFDASGKVIERKVGAAQIVPLLEQLGTSLPGER